MKIHSENRGKWSPILDCCFKFITCECYINIKAKRLCWQHLSYFLIAFEKILHNGKSEDSSTIDSIVSEPTLYWVTLFQIHSIFIILWMFIFWCRNKVQLETWLSLHDCLGKCLLDSITSHAKFVVIFFWVTFISTAAQ